MKSSYHNIGFEQWFDISNWISGSQTEITSNNDMRGKYNRDLACRSEGQQIVGMQVRKKTHHGITNFRVLCA